MPMDWVPPEVAFRHGGFVVYYTYRNDHAQDCANERTYTLTSGGGPCDAHGDAGVIHVDDLELEVPADYLPDEKDDAVRTIKYHIDQGEFDDWEADEEAIENDPEIEVKLSLLQGAVDYLASCVAGADLNEPDPDRRESGVNEYLQLKEIVDAANASLRCQRDYADQAHAARQARAEQSTGDSDGS